LPFWGEGTKYPLHDEVKLFIMRKGEAAPYWCIAIGEVPDNRGFYVNSSVRVQKVASQPFTVIFQVSPPN
jgi:hypothetical protein